MDVENVGSGAGVVARGPRKAFGGLGGGGGVSGGGGGGGGLGFATTLQQKPGAARAALGDITNRAGGGGANGAAAPAAVKKGAGVRVIVAAAAAAAPAALADPGPIETFAGLGPPAVEYDPFACLDDALLAQLMAPRYADDDSELALVRTGGGGRRPASPLIPEPVALDCDFTAAGGL